MIDTHCHLDAAEFDADRDEVFGAARQGGVSAIVVPGVAVDAFAFQKIVVERYAGCRAAYGIHPLYVPKAEMADLDVVRDYLKQGAPVAVGEIGLDHFVPGQDDARQAEFFVAQLKLAREFDLPVILHVRRAVDSVLKYLRRYPVRGGIAHAFNGSEQQAAAFESLGFCLGFGGAATYAGSRRIRKLLATLPSTAIVLETDAPDIAPSWLPGGRNSPAELPRIAAELAQVRGASLAEFIVQTRENACRVLPGLGK
ncbi:MAG: TatD family hydrolase [Azonexus sp.]|nr:TatD family hydrolase [Azonexus sp.]